MKNNVFSFYIAVAYKFHVEIKFYSYLWRTLYTLHREREREMHLHTHIYKYTFYAHIFIYL